MDLKDLLEESDIELINALRTEAARDVDIGQSYINTKDWLDIWADAKMAFGSIFQNSLILTKDIDYSLTEEDLREKLNTELLHWTTGDPECIKLFQTIEDEIEYLRAINANARLSILDLCSAYALAKGYYTGHDVDIPMPDNSIFKLRQGMKVNKALGQICEKLHIDSWEPVRIKISQVLNEKTFKGKLHLSIHPADYLTASINGYKWRSCMDFFDGDYRRGVIEMMNSPYVIVGYLTGTGDKETFEVCDDIYASNKKWREFFICSPDIITGVKGYPYCNEELEKLCCEWLRELVNEASIYNTSETGIYRTQKFTKYQHYTPYTVKYIPGSERKFVFSPSCGPAMYNDFSSSREVGGCFALPPEELSLDYSGPGECVICGSTNFRDLEDQTRMVTCCNCTPMTRCHRCGDLFMNSDLIGVGDFYYCNNCYEYLYECDSCGELFDQDEDFAVVDQYLGTKTDEQVVVYRHNFCLCPNCADRYFTQDAWYNRYVYGNWRNYYYFTVDELTPDGLEYFNIDSPENYDACLEETYGIAYSKFIE